MVQIQPITSLSGQRVDVCNEIHMTVTIFIVWVSDLLWVAAAPSVVCLSLRYIDHSLVCGEEFRVHSVCACEEKFDTLRTPRVLQLATLTKADVASYPTPFSPLLLDVDMRRQSFLIEITATIFGKKDDLTDEGYVVDKILDKTGERCNKMLEKDEM